MLTVIVDVFIFRLIDFAEISIPVNNLLTREMQHSWNRLTVNTITTGRSNDSSNNSNGVLEKIKSNTVMNYLLLLLWLTVLF